jgi:1-deoxy-D-xylulose-5-phosphate reductoisomerase
MAGLAPTLAVIETGRRLALANKESLVIAGVHVLARARETGCEIIPVDSEHSAIFQALRAGEGKEVKRLILTASGGPFRGKSREDLGRVTKADALKHPTWQMGQKITIDSATMMNKGFEVIEAAHLFGVSPDRIHVVIHPESMIHSAVEYIDGTVIAEMSLPDMRSCVRYALFHPHRVEANVAPLDFFALGKLTFEAPDLDAFPLLGLAGECFALGGAMPAVLNAANEVAVAAFLSERISFLAISEIVREVVERLSYHRDSHTLAEILAADAAARAICEALCTQ